MLTKWKDKLRLSTLFSSCLAVEKRVAIQKSYTKLLANRYVIIKNVGTYRQLMRLRLRAKHGRIPATWPAKKKRKSISNQLYKKSPPLKLKDKTVKICNSHTYTQKNQIITPPNLIRNSRLVLSFAYLFPPSSAHTHTP